MSDTKRLRELEEENTMFESDVSAMDSTESAF